MAKKKSKSEIEYLRGENRRLVAENKRLRKKHNLPTDMIEALEEETDIDLLCTECGKGEIQEFDAGIKIILTCKLCGVRKVENK